MDRNFRSFKLRKFLSLVLGLVLVSIFTAYPTSTVNAAINNTINFQSKIVDKTTGLNISTGSPACVKSGSDTCDFQVSIWNDATGSSTASGSGNLMFTQTFQDVEIGNTNGIFNLIINSCGSSKSGTSHWGTSTGTCTVVDDSDSDSDAGVNFDRADLWIEVSFAPADSSGSLGTFSEVFSRTNLKSVPSAFVAQTLSGIGADGFVQLAPSAAQVSTSTNSLINLETTANTSNSLLKLNENGVGTPNLLDLQVAGSSVFSVGNSGNLAAGSASLSNASTFNISKTYSSGSSANGLILGTTTNSNTSFTSISGISNTVSLTSSTTYGLSPIITGLSNRVSNSTNIGSNGQVRGIYNQIDFTGSRTYNLNNITGENIYISTGTGSGTVGRIVGLDVAISKWSESVEDLKGINISTFSGPATTATNVYGLYVDNQTIGTNDYGIYVAGADTYAIWTDSGVNRFDGNVLAGTITNSAYLNIAAATASQASILIESSAGTDPSSPTSGNLWWNGTNLNFRTGSSTVDLLANAAGSFVNFTPAATQTTTSTNSLINLTSTATSATNPLILVNEDGTGTPNLLSLQVAGSSRFLVANSGNVTAVGSLTSVGVNSGTGLIQGTGGLTITGAAVSLNVGSNFAVNIGTGTSSGTITLGGTATQTLNLGNGAGGKTVNLGSNNTTSTTTILSGSGGLHLNVNNNQSTNIGTGTTTGTVTIGGTGTQTISIANGAGNKTLNLGSSNTGSTTTLLSGSGGLHLNVGNNQTTNINTGSSTGTVNIGGGNGNVVINANNWGVNSSGQAGLGVAASSSSYLVLGAATNAASSIRLTSSSGTNVSSPISGDLWWNGTSLNFNNGTSTVDLLAGGSCSTCVSLAPAATQSSTSTNSFINLTSTATGATNPLILVNENGTGTPNLLDLQIAGSSVFTVNNNGGASVLGNSAIGPAAAINMTPADYASWGSNTFTNILSLASSPTTITGNAYTGLLTSLNLNTSSNTTTRIIGVDNHIYIPTTNSNNFQSIVGLSSMVYPEGTGTINSLVGGQFEAVPSDWLGASAADVYGIKSATGGATNVQYAAYLSAGNTLGAPQTYGLYTSSYNFSTTASNTYGAYITSRSSGAVSSGTNNVFGVYSDVQVTNATSNSTNVYGYYLSNAINSGTTQNAYGLYMNNVTGAANNYGIYIAGAGTYAIWSDSGVNRFDGNILAGTTTNTAYLNIAGATSAQASLRLESSAGTNPSSPNSGDLWWNGTSLNFNNGTSTIDLLAGGSCSTCVQFAPTSIQTTSSNNNLIYLETTGNVEDTLIKVDENGAGTPALIDLRVDTNSMFSVDNYGDVWANGFYNSRGLVAANDLTDSILNLTSTATGATNPLILVNEDGTGTPNLLDLRVGGISKFVVNNNGGLAIGDGTAINSLLDVRNTYTNTSGFISMQYNQMTLNPASNSTATLISSWNQALTGSGNANTINRIVGIYNQAIHQGTNTLSNATGVLGEIKVDSTGGITTANGAELNAQLTGGGNIGTLRNLYVNNATVSAGTITDNYGLYVVNQTAGTNDYGIYVAGADTYSLFIDAGVSRFDGDVGINTASPSANLDVFGTIRVSNSLSSYANFAQGGDNIFSVTTSHGGLRIGSVSSNTEKTLFFSSYDNTQGNAYFLRVANNNSFNIVNAYDSTSDSLLNITSNGGVIIGIDNNNDDTNNSLIIRSNASGSILTILEDGTTSLNTSTNTALFNIGAATTSQASLRLVSSAGTNPSSPNSGDVWWNGTNLNFRTGSSTIDLLANATGSFVNFASGSTQSSSNANSLIDLTTTGSVSSSLIKVNENGAGAPNLLDLQVAGTSRLTLTNSGNLSLPNTSSSITLGGDTQITRSVADTLSLGAGDSLSINQGQLIIDGVTSLSNKYGIQLYSTNTGNSSNQYGIYSNSQAAPGTGNTAASLYGIYSAAGMTDLGDDFGTITNLYSGYFVANSDGGNITNNYALYANAISSSGNISTNYGLYVNNSSSVGTTATYGIYVNNSTTGAAGYYGIYSDGGWNKFTGRTALGGSDPQAAVLSISDTGIGDSYGIYSQMSFTGSGYKRGLSVNNYYGGNTLGLYAIDASAQVSPGSSNTMGLVTGLNSNVSLNSAGTVTNAYGGQFRGSATLGTIGTLYGISIGTATTSSGGVITNNYGLHIANQTAGTNDYGIYVEGADTYALFVDAGTSRFDGNIFVGNTTETISSSSFVMNGDDVFINGQLGVEGSIFSDSDILFSAGVGRLSSANGNYIPGYASIGQNPPDTRYTLNLWRSYFSTSNSLDYYGASSYLQLDGTSEVAGGLIGFNSTFNPVGNVTNIKGFESYVYTTQATSTVTNASGFYVKSTTDFGGGGGTITNNYGLYIENQDYGTNDYGIYIAGADTYAIWSDSGVNRFDGNILAGTTTNTAFVNIAGATSAQASLRLLSSSGMAPSSPNSGDLWWDGGSLVFYSGSSYYDLLNPSFSCPSCLTLAPSGTQSTSSTNSLINIATTGNTSNPLVNITENGAGTPDLLRLNVGVTNRAKITNNGQLEIVGNTNATNLLNIGGTYSTASGGNSVFSLSANQTVASTGSMDVLNLFTSFSGSGTLAGMNGALIRPQSTGSGTITNASGIAIWPKANTGSFGNLYGLNIYDAEVGGGGAISNYYGLYVTNLTTGTNSYGLYVAGAKTNAIYANTGTSSTIGLRIQGVSSQSANYIDIIDNSSSPVFNITSTGNVNANTFIASGVFTANAAVNTRIQASGTGSGSTGTGSIYFLGSDGSTKGRIDTVNTDQLKTEGDGSDGAITISASITWDSAILATGRTTYADGIAYRVNPPGIGDTAVTRYRSADNLSNGIVAGDEVLVINLQGNLIGTGTTAVFDNASVGNYEFRTVASVSASTITFTEPLEHRYLGLNQNQQRVVIQRVPNYTNVTVNSGGIIGVNSYEGLTTVPTGSAGYRTGIIAFRANGTVTVNTGGSIVADSDGYRGGAAGAAGANGGFNGESYDNTGNNTTGRGGSGASGGESWGGGRASNGAVANPVNGIPRGGGGGGGSNGSASTGDDGSGAGGGGGYGGGGGGGGGGSNAAAQNGGAGGTGGATEVAAGGGGGAQNTAAAGAAGGNAGSAGSNATGTGGSAGDGKISGSGGGGAKITTAGGAGGGGGGLYGFPDLSAMFLGSGGGGGAGGFSTNTAGTAGGNGGGAIYIGADTITLPGSGTITANGGAATNGTAPASGGGGGSGGSIYLDAFNVSVGTSLVTANGGAAGTQAARRGAAGGGGVGRIFIKYRTFQSGTTSPSATVAQITHNYGTLHIGSVNTAQADLAEYYVTGDREIEAGDVVSISPYRLVGNNEEEITSQGVLRKTSTAYDSKLIGVISTAPGLTLGSIDGETGNQDQRALALSGRVPVKIDPDSEPISIGDYLTSSTKAGYAKKATQPGYVLGKALEYWNKDLNKPKIMTFVGLGYYNGGNSSTEEALRLASSRGLSVSNAYNPSVNIKIVQSATDGQVLGTTTEPSTTLEAGQVDESVSVEALEKSMSLALGRSEMSDYFLNNDSSITVGDVVKFDLNNNLIKAGGINNRGDTEVLGVTSTQPNTLLSAILETSNNSSVTLGGKVVLKVTDLNGPIKKGDYLAASDIPGYAMKADNANGIILGRALEDFPLSVSPDSSLVKRELSRNKTEMINLLNNLIADGSIKAEDKQKYEDAINQFTSSFEISNVDGKSAGRILAFVNIGFITEGVMLPKNANLADNSLPGTTEEVSKDLSNLLNQIQKTKLTLNNVLTVKNVIEAQTYQNITGLDLAFKISSQNNSFKVVNVNDESIFQVDQNGKISIKSGSNSSIGKAVLPPGTIELFVENTSITESSQIYLTPDQFVFSRVKSKNPGQGFWIELQNGFTDKTVNVDYLIIN